MRTMKLLSIFVALTLLASLGAFTVIAAPQTQGGNLLRNSSWEQGSQGGWDWWYLESIVMKSDNKKEPDLDVSFYAPNFMPSEAKWDKESNGAEGAAGAISGKQHTKFRAGFVQTVDVAAGARVRFTVWVNEYCQDEEGGKCPVILKAGIDPNGGGNWQSGDIRWVEIQIANNKYVQLTTDEVTVGPNGKVSVFTWGEPKYPVIYNAAYFDEAVLTITAAAPAATATAAPQPTQPPAPAQPAACAQLRWVSDVTIPDGMAIAPGAQFVKTWRVRNAGSCTFSGTLNFIGTGNRMGGTSPTVLPKVDPGQQADVSINLTAPTQPGDYQGTWQPRTSDGTAMENLIVKIKVSADAAPPIAAVTATPQGQAPTPAASPTPATGQICILAYNDRNSNSQEDADESPLPGVIFTLSDASGPRDSWTTDGVSEPHCFMSLQPGSYQLTAKPPANYSATTQKTFIVALNGGVKTDWSFGARRGGPAPTPTRAGDASASGGISNTVRIVLIVLAVLVLIGLGFVGGFVLLTRRV